MELYVVTMEQVETICNPNNICVGWYEDDADGFAGAVVDAKSTEHLAGLPIVNYVENNTI